VSGQEHEEGENYVIDRVRIPKHASGMLDQVKSYIVYYKQAKSLIKGEKYDLVYASSSRLFTAFLGKRCAVKNKCPLYLDIRDIFVESIRYVYEHKPLIRVPFVFLLSKIENYTFKKANHINLVSEGFNYHFTKYPKPSYSYFTNGIDDEFLEIKQTEESIDNNPKIIIYAGNIGKGQGLEKVVPEAAQKLGDGYKFQIIGEGGTKDLLLRRVEELGLNNVEWIKPVSRTELIKYYQKADYFFFHLNDLEHHKYVLPSKMFEYGAFDKPIIAGVAGYPRQFIETNLTNYIVFEPTKVDEFIEKFKSYEYKREIRTAFIQKFARKTIMSLMADDILSYI
jgi:glycosyltransferase involved in cell wall biosynthesis